MTMRPLLAPERRILAILASYDSRYFVFSTKVGAKCEPGDWNAIPSLFERGFIAPYVTKLGTATGRLIKITPLGRSALEIDESIRRDATRVLTLADLVRDLRQQLT